MLGAALRKRELQKVHGLGEGVALPFAQKKVHGLGHHYVSVNEDAEFCTHVLKAGEKEIVGHGGLKARFATITPEGEEMRLAGMVVAPQPLGMKET